MTTLKKTLLAAAALTAVSSFAYALEIGDWMMDANTAYVYNNDGKTMSIKMHNPDHNMMMQNAHKVPRNTVFFMMDGQLYQRTGKWDFMGGPA